MLPIVDSSSLSPLLRGLLNAATFLFALVLLERSADVFVDSTAAVARRFSIPTILIAMLTAGAEWEELAVVVSSLVSHNPSLAVSNIYGSFTGNILSSFSIGLLFAPAALHAGERRSAVIYSSVLLALSGTVAILAIPAISDQLGGAPGSPGMLRGRLVGGGLVAAFVVYVAAICWGIYRGAVVAPEDSDSDSDDDSPVPVTPTEPTESSALLPPSSPHHRSKSTVQHIFLLILSTFALSVSGFLLSATTTSLATLLGLSQSTLGITLLSVSTTLPEKIVAYKAGTKKQTGVLIANTVGSNVFLGTLVLGIVYLVEGRAVYSYQDKRGSGEVVDVSVMLASAVLLWAIVWVGKFRPWMGVVMLLLYGAYLLAVLFSKRQ